MIRLSDDEAFTGRGRECGLSVSIAPRMMTIVGLQARNVDTRMRQKLRHRRFGSGPEIATRSRWGMWTTDMRIVGQRNVDRPLTISTFGRVVWKS